MPVFPQSEITRAKIMKARVAYFEDYTSMPVVAGIDSVVKSAVLRREPMGDMLKLLTSEECEVALLPAIECLKSANLAVLQAPCVAVRGASRLFMLYSNRLPTEIHRVLVDKEDYGVTPLAQLLFRKKLMIDPQFFHSNTPFTPGEFSFGENADYDAYLVTGRNCFFIRSNAFSFTWDLTQVWFEYSQLPFVVHCWATRRGVPLGSLDKELGDAAKRNETSKDVATKAADKWGISQSGVSAVYTRAITTNFDAMAIQGIRRYAQELNAARITPVRPVTILTGAAASPR
jgi:predicted solute-binding protein